MRLLQISEGLEIGSKRNFGCGQARGSIIAHWDDDDFSAPGRLADQVSRLVVSGLAVTGYHSMRFTDGSSCWWYSGTRNYSIGTALVYRRDWWEGHPFLGLQVGEDNRFVEIAARARQLLSVDAGDLMYATIHEANTSPRKLHGSNLKRICMEGKCIHRSQA